MKSHNEFVKEVIKANSVPEQARKALDEDSQSQSDLNAIKNQIGDVICEGDEK